MSVTPKVFISYSHDSENHKFWVGKLASDLRESGIEVVLDQWALEPGSNLGHFMEQGLSTSDRVLAICTDNYNEKSNSGRGGVGYEKTILTAELLTDQTTTKFVPLIRSVESDAKTPVCLSGRLYIDFSNDDDYGDSLKELVNAIHRPSKQPDCKSDSEILDPPEIEQAPELSEGSTVFFDKRFSSAFPGVRGIEWFEKEKAIERLLILFKKPIFFTNARPIWWWGHGDLQIESFERLSNETVLMDWQELKIRKIAAVNQGSYYQKLVYVEVEPMEPTGLYDYNLEQSIKEIGFAREEYAIFDRQNIKREEYDDGAAIVNGSPVDLHGKAELRARYLSEYNFFIAPLKSPINCNTFDARRRQLLRDILLKKVNIETIAAEVLKLPKR